MKLALKHRADEPPVCLPVRCSHADRREYTNRQATKRIWLQISQINADWRKSFKPRINRIYTNHKEKKNEEFCHLMGHSLHSLLS